MKKFTANYCKSNSNFIITNLPDKQVDTPYSSIVRIVQNIIMRGNPTFASVYLQRELGLERDYIDNLDEVKFISNENLDWSQTIKGDESNDDYPAIQFYDDLNEILKDARFIRNLAIAECPIKDIVPEINNAFVRQQVDFYIPLVKTVFEVDGHYHENQLTLDRKRDKAFKRFGVKVIRINTKDIRNRNYEQFKRQFREIYRQNLDIINNYRKFLNMDLKKYDVQIKLTSIIRLQVLILELLDRGVISFQSRYWDFNVFTKDTSILLELALKDLELWIANIAALFNMRINMPHININVFEDEAMLPLRQNNINIKIDIFKRWDDSIKETNVYNIRTDFDDTADYFNIKVKDPVVYSINSNTHQKNLEFLLENIFGYTNFNDGQLDIIINCLNGEDTVGLLPTGGGKSLIYQMCIMLQPAISFVVDPIKSLMKDQIDNLIFKHRITHVSYINSNLSAKESDSRLRGFSSGKYFFIIISPERFQAKRFREELSLVNRTKAISIAVIDEVHSMSEWGHQFMTAYLVLANTIRKLAPSARFLALTATASSKVLKDIMTELEIESHNVLTISQFTRPELNFDIIPINKKGKKDKLIEILTKDDSNHYGKNAALVFTQTVNGLNGCYQLYGDIQLSTGLKTAFYSGNAPKKWAEAQVTPFEDYKDHIQASFMKDEIDVLVATKAFGMGIDKGNIRQTIHYGIPDSLESFYQEAGRAGRDRNPSNCIVLYSPDKLDEKQLQNIFGTKTDVTLLTAEKKKLSGDLNTLIFFLANNLTDIETEVANIYDFYQFISEDHNLVVWVEWHKDKERETKEKYIYRLALLGIVDDWTIDYKLKRFEVVLLEKTEQEITQHLVGHIQKYEYTFTLQKTNQMSTQYQEYIDYFNNHDIPFLKRALFVLLKWYNDNVIYQRKRSILLMKQYADEFTDSDSLQQKIEMYFKRNDDVYLLERIVGNKERIKDWYKIFYVKEEGKADTPRALSTFKSLKITISRFLESYKNDIALNLINGLISLAEDNFEDIDGRERMASAIQEIVTFSPDEQQEMLQSILVTSDLFLDTDQKSQLSEVLISNGLNQMNDLRRIYSTFEDEYSYGSMLWTLNTTLQEKSPGGYPWEI